MSSFAHVRTAVAAALCAPALALVAPATPSAVAQPARPRGPITSVTVFGDSLSDVGTFRATTGDPHNPGAFTVNPGRVWVQRVAAHYGLTVTPHRSVDGGSAHVLGGNGYAEGGARVASYPSQSGIGNERVVAPVAVQLRAYLAEHGSFDKQQLVIMSAGGNDTFAQFSAVCWGVDNNGTGAGTTTFTSATRAVARAARAEVRVIRRMRAHGARHILVSTAPDWGRNPFGRQHLSPGSQASGCSTPVPASRLTGWTKRFNRILTRQTRRLRGVHLFDTSRVLNAAVRHPRRYGLRNVTDPACTNTSPSTAAVYCTQATLVAPDAARTYLWSDDFHPTPRGHALLAQAALRALPPRLR